MGPEKQIVGNLASIRRLPAYLHLLRQISNNGRDIASSTYIAEKLNLAPIQVRKDLAITGITGKTKVGYYVPKLISAIEDFLGWNNQTDAFLAGAGNLGSALIGYGGFGNNNLKIVAAFDCDDAKIGTEISDVLVLPIEKLPELARRMHISMGIITVPEGAAQAVADLMVGAGITAIWNFSPRALTVPEDVVVQNESLFSGFAVLTVKANRAKSGPIVQLAEDESANL